MINKCFLVGLICLSTITLVSQSLAKDGNAYSQPCLLTSSGQAADVLIMKGLCTRTGLDFTFVPQATSKDLSEVKTLIITAGGSSKGLGAAKIDPDVEMNRIRELSKAAVKMKIPILMFHIGGEARRGALSDPFNILAADDADMLMVVQTGDKDQFFKKIAEKNKREYVSLEKQFDVIDQIKILFDMENSE